MICLLISFDDDGALVRCCRYRTCLEPAHRLRTHTLRHAGSVDCSMTSNSDASDSVRRRY
jgi:hypothetical protein